MKICFSTLGCPGWSWEDIVATAKDFKYNGIEIRGIEKELYVPNTKPFLPEQIKDTKNQLNELGLDISCLTSSCYLHIANQKERTINEAKEYMDIAEQVNCKYVRVLGDTDPQPGENVNVENVVESLKELGDYALSKNVMILIESNGVFADSQKLKEVLSQTNNPSIGVLWDIHHPYRFMNESITQTYTTLKEYIRHIHIKDSVIENGKVLYKMMGQGDIPIKECIDLLKKDQYDGYISLEWVKRWYTDLEDPGIVFMQFANYIKELWEMNHA